jgi:hypothetical protein
MLDKREERIEKRGERIESREDNRLEKMKTRTGILSSWKRGSLAVQSRKWKIADRESGKENWKLKAGISRAS